MDLDRLTQEHRGLVSRAATLAGLATTLRTRSDAVAARSLLLALDGLAMAHLEAEDREVYSVLMADPDPAVRAQSAAAFEEVGSLIGAWRQFREHWTSEAILADPARFAATTECALEALMLRVALEEDALYPAARRATLTQSPAMAVA